MKRNKNLENQRQRQHEQLMAEAIDRLRSTPADLPPSDFMTRLVPPRVTEHPRTGQVWWVVSAGAAAAGVAALAYRIETSRPTQVAVAARSNVGGALLSPSEKPKESGTRIVERNPSTGHPPENRNTPVIVHDVQHLAWKEKPRTEMPTTDGPAPRAAKVVNDTDFLSPGSAGVVANLTGRREASQKRLPFQYRDDFVKTSDMIYTAGPGSDLPELEQGGQQQQKQQAAAVDPKLFHQVSLALKHASMEEVCAELSRQTGAYLKAGRNVRDDNATIFVSSRPAREVMREISRVFGFVWQREGDENSYTYTLRQETQAEVAEENLRNDDISKATQALGQRLRSDHDAKNPQADAGREVFRSLLPEELTKLQSGAKLKLASHPDTPQEGNLDPDGAQKILMSMGGVKPFMDSYMQSLDLHDPAVVPYTKMGNPEASITFHLRVTEFGGAKLHAEIVAIGKDPAGHDQGGGVSRDLGEVPGVAERRVENEKLNADLQRSPGMDQGVKIQPILSIPLAEQGTEPYFPPGVTTVEMFLGSYRTSKAIQPPRPFVTSDDVWQAIHEATHKDVVADSFSRLFAQETYEGRQFDALCKACDAIHYNWRLDEGFLTGRSSSYYWQRGNEVPKRLLLRWQAQRKVTGYLPLRSVLEMAQLSDRALDALEVGKAIVWQWHLPDWGVPSRPFWPNEYETVRPIARFLASMPDDALAAAERGDLQAGSLPRSVLAKLDEAGTNDAEDAPADTIFEADYIPAGKYYWRPLFEHGKEQVHTDLIIGDSVEDVRRKVAQLYPNRPDDEFERSEGRICLLVKGKNGTRQMGDERYAEGSRNPG